MRYKLYKRITVFSLDILICDTVSCDIATIVNLNVGLPHKIFMFSTVLCYFVIVVSHSLC